MLALQNPQKAYRLRIQQPKIEGNERRPKKGVSRQKDVANVIPAFTVGELREAFQEQPPGEVRKSICPRGHRFKRGEVFMHRNRVSRAGVAPKGLVWQLSCGTGMSKLAFRRPPKVLGIVAVGCFLALSAPGITAHATTIQDSPLIPENQRYTRVYGYGADGNPKSNYAWVDEIPWNGQFQVSRIDVNYVDDDVQFVIYTNYDLGGENTSVGFLDAADLAINLSGPGGFIGEVGVAFSQDGSDRKATLYTGLERSDWYSSIELGTFPKYTFGSGGGVRFGGKWADCVKGVDCPDPNSVDAKEALTEIIEGTAADHEGQTVIATDLETGDPDLFEWAFTLEGVNATGDYDSLELFWGTALCSNDGIHGVAFNENVANPVPVPAALPLLASAVAGLGFVGYRRNRAS